MLALMKEEFDEYFKQLPDIIPDKINISIATGIASYSFINGLVIGS